MHTNIKSKIYCTPQKIANTETKEYKKCNTRNRITQKTMKRQKLYTEKMMSRTSFSYVPCTYFVIFCENDVHIDSLLFGYATKLYLFSFKSLNSKIDQNIVCFRLVPGGRV